MIGGQELAVDALAREFLALGHRPVVLTPRLKNRWRLGDEELPYPVARHPAFYSMRIAVDWYRYLLLRWRRREALDVLHVHGLYPAGYLAARCREALGLPLVLTSHGEDVYEQSPRLADPRLGLRHLAALEAADALVAISGFTREGYRRLCPSARRIVDIPNGVDAAAFFAPASRPAGWDPQIVTRGYAAFLGRLDPRKGVDVLLDALARVPTRCGIELVIAGDGPHRRELEAQSQRLGLSDRVRFVGAVRGEAKAYLLQNARFLVAPSRGWEGAPLVVLEAFAAGCPVVASRLPGFTDLIQPDRTGWLVTPESVDELAGVLARLLADAVATKTLRPMVVDVARQHSWNAIARRHLDLYQELLGGLVESRHSR
jgi:glycosyltransferase involved in cell wall biosynthesis